MDANAKKIAPPDIMVMAQRAQNAQHPAQPADMHKPSQIAMYHKTHR